MIKRLKQLYSPLVIFHLSIAISFILTGNSYAANADLVLIENTMCSVTQYIEKTAEIIGIIGIIIIGYEALFGKANFEKLGIHIFGAVIIIGSFSLVGFITGEVYACA